MHDWGQIPRAIGQGLEARRVKSQFHIECRGDECRVWAKMPEAPESRLRSVLRRMHLPHHAQSAPLADTQKEDSGAVYFWRFPSFYYGPADLEWLEDEGEAKRRDPNGMPDPYSPSQLLRALGSYVGRRAARFVALSWTEEFVALVYETAEGRRNVESFTLASI